MICAVLAGLPPRAGAQAIERGLLLAGLFSETSRSLSLQGNGETSPGASLDLGFELVGFPASPWQFDLAARYRAFDADADSSDISWGAGLRAGYSLGLGALLDIVPLAGIAVDSPFGAFDGTLSLEAALKLNLYLGSWSYVSLIPQCSIPIGGDSHPSIGIGIGFKQLLAWSDRRRRSTPTTPLESGKDGANSILYPAEGRSSAGTFAHMSISAEPILFSPDGDGFNDSLSILIKIDKPESVRSWNLTIEDGRQHRFYGRSGSGTPPTEIKWDGNSNEGQLVESASEYSIRFSASDGAGRELQVTKSFSTDVLVIRDGERYKIRIPDFVFPADSAELNQGQEASFVQQNAIVLNRLAEILRRFSAYRITIEGHANLVNWNDPALADKEEREVLMPLSRRRAEAVKAALAGIGIDGGRMKVVGRGGHIPLAPNGDTANNWKNRRVEILLDR